MNLVFFLMELLSSRYFYLALLAYFAYPVLGSANLAEISLSPFSLAGAIFLLGLAAGYLIFKKKSAKGFSHFIFFCVCVGLDCRLSQF